MHELERAHHQATTTGADVVALMKSIQVLLDMCEVRIMVFLSSSDAARDGALRSLTADVSRLFSIALDIGQVACATAATVRASVVAALAGLPRSQGDDPEAASLLSECERTLQALATVESTIQHIEQQATQGLETLREAVLQRDMAPDAMQTFDALLRRIQHPRAQG